MAAKVEIDILANDKTGGALGNVASGLGNILSTAAGFITGQVLMGAANAVGDLFTSTISEASEAQTSLAQLNAALKSTGGAAGLSSQELQNYAGQLQDITAYDDEAIQGAEGLLLTFTNIKGDNFKEATSLALDMSTALGQDLKSSSMQLGKALNDPIQGIGALSRVGVQFTDDQKKMIEEMVNSGDTMGAQKVIMDELNKEFGGSAEAFAGTYAGKMQQFNNKMGDIKETIGNAVLPVMTQFMDDVVTPLMPMIADLATRFGEWMQSMKDNGTIDAIMTALSGIGPMIDTVLGYFDGLSSFTMEGTPLGNFFAYLQQWGTEYGPGLMESFSSIFGTIWDVLSYVFTAIGDVFNNAFGGITLWLEENGPLIQEFTKQFAEQLAIWGDVIKVVIDVIKPILDGLILMILDVVQFVMAIATGDWKRAWDAIISFVTHAITGIGLALKALWDGILRLFGTSSAELGAKWNLFWIGIANKVNEWKQALVNKVTEFFNAGKAIVQGVIDGFNNMKQKVIDTLTAIAGGAIDAFKKLFGIASPSKVFEGFGKNMMQGLANGIGDGATVPVKVLGDVMPKIGNVSTGMAGGYGAVAGGGIVINIDARDSLIDERWFATKFKTGVVQILRDTGVAFNG